MRTFRPARPGQDRHAAEPPPRLERKDCGSAELKSLDAAGRFQGLAAAFGNVDRVGDVIERGAFGELDPRRVALLWQHDARQPIGIWRELREGDRGLIGVGHLALDTQMGREAHALLKAGALSGLSIGFNVPPGGSSHDRKANVRRLRRVELWEVSLVTFPANDQARVSSVKDALAAGRTPTPRELEELLREHGLSARQAKGVVAAGYAGLGPDAEAAELAAAIRALAARLRT